MKRTVSLCFAFLLVLSGCRKAMSPEQLIREAAANLAKSDRLHLQVALTLDPQDGSEAEPGNLGMMELFADGLQGNAGHLGGDVRFLSNGETVTVDFYSDGEWVYATIDGEGVRIPIAGTGMDGLLTGMRLPAASEFLSEPEVQVEEDRTLLIYRFLDGELNSMLEKSAGGLGLLLPNGIPVLGDGEMVIVLSEGEIREITCNVLTVGESPTEFQAAIAFLDTTDMFEPKPPEGYDTFPELAVKEIAGAVS